MSEPLDMMRKRTGSIEVIAINRGTDEYPKFKRRKYTSLVLQTPEQPCLLR